MDSTQEESVKEAIYIAKNSKKGQWINSCVRSSESIHTRKECSLLNQSSGKQEASIGQIRYHELTECKKCRKMRERSELTIDDRIDQPNKKLRVRFTGRQMGMILEAKDRIGCSNLSGVVNHCVSWFFEQDIEQQTLIDRATDTNLDDSLLINFTHQQMKQIVEVVSSGRAPSRASVIREAVVARLISTE